MRDDFLAFLKSRRSLRRYTSAPIPRPVLERVLTAGIWSPSAHNRQPWRFVVLEDANTRHALASAMGARLRADLEADSVPKDVIAADVARSYERMTLAPCLLLLCLTMADMDSYPDPRRNAHERVMAIQSVAMAGQNMLLMAHAEGLGACWMCAPLFCPDVVRDVLGLPADWEAQGMIALGYPAQTREKNREGLEKRALWR